MNHPINRDAITDDNYREIADALFHEQLKTLRDYADMLLERHYSDDDTDYLRTALNATETLMDISYDGLRDDLIDFLFMSRNDYTAIYEAEGNDQLPRHEPLHYINSAGGLTDNLYAYTNPLDDAEEASNA